MCGGDFMSKNPEEDMDFLSYVAKVSRGWDESNAKEVGRMKSQPNAPNVKARLLNLKAHQPQHSARERKVPSQPHQNPKGIHEVEAQEGESSQVREVKAVITLRSGKELDLPTSKPEHEPESEAEKEKMRKSKERENGTVQRMRTLNLL
ncbi:hypothetical protein CK203_109500 [Vitis vinifera]|uniref:Uncharacterized protein n=1 Tax=Vitis vinifera TaxID=29760 RepID=A0A438CHA2_VITVI|nr:hypothetical protein CK203_109500 [Vitis vinifera]